MYSRILRTCGLHADATAQKVLFLACQLFDAIVVKMFSFDLRFEFFVSVLIDLLFHFSFFNFLSHDIKTQRGGHRRAERLQEPVHEEEGEDFHCQASGSLPRSRNIFNS